jgi:hypothetical protein
VSALRRTLRNIGFLATLIALFYCVIGAFDPPRTNWGDSESDYNVMISGRNFARYGFLDLRLTPHLIDKQVMTEADTVLLYTHYPQLPDLMNGVYRKVFGFDDVIPFRLVALCWSFGSLVFLYRLMAAFWTRKAAQIALALYVSNFLWLQHADYLHHGPYGAFFGFGSLYFLDRYFRDGRRALFIASGLFLFFAYSASYDYWIFTPVLLAAITAYHLGSSSWKRAAAVLGGLALFALASIAAKVATNMWAMGASRFLHDLRFQLVERSTDRVMQTAFDNGAWVTLRGRIRREFTLLFRAVPVFWLLVPIGKRLLGPRAGALAAIRVNPLAVLLAAIPFLIVFRELWIAQFYPFLMLVPFYAIGFALIITLLLDSRGRVIQALGIVLMAFLIIESVRATAFFKKVFADRGSLLAVKARLDSLAPPGQWVLSNTLAESRYRYYFDRNMVPLIIHQPQAAPYLLDHFSDPANSPYAGAQGSVFVQEKHLTDMMFDKGYYWPVARFGWWNYAANPDEYRGMLDLFIHQRDSSLAVTAATIGTRVYEDDHYIVWKLPSSRPFTGPIRQLRPFRLP